MKQIRTVALSRHTAPSFVLLAGLELLRARKVDPWVRWLFVEILAMADFATGHVKTTYPVLGSLLDFDRTPGAHAVPKITKRRLELALQQLCELKLVRDFDPQRNQRLGGLFFRVDGRGGISAANERSVQGNVHPRKPAKLATARVSKASRAEEGAGERARVQERAISPLPPSFSTDAKPSRTVMAMRAKLLPRAGGPLK